MFIVNGEADFVLKSDGGRVLLFNTALVLAKSARDTQGVQVMRMTKGAQLAGVYPAENADIKDPEQYRVKSVPSGGIASDIDIDQLKLI